MKLAGGENIFVKCFNDLCTGYVLVYVDRFYPSWLNNERPRCAITGKDSCECKFDDGDKIYLFSEAIYVAHERAVREYDD